MSIYRRVHVTVKFSVQEELVPGLFYDPQDFADSAARDIMSSLIAYKPEILDTKIETMGKEEVTK